MSASSLKKKKDQSMYRLSIKFSIAYNSENQWIFHSIYYVIENNEKLAILYQEY